MLSNYTYVYIQTPKSHLLPLPLGSEGGAVGSTKEEVDNKANLLQQRGDAAYYATAHRKQQPVPLTEGGDHGEGQGVEGCMGKYKM